MAEYDQYLLDNPTHVRVYTSAPYHGDPILQATGGHKPPEAFRDILREVKKKNRNLLSGGTSVETF